MSLIALYCLTCLIALILGLTVHNTYVIMSPFVIYAVYVLYTVWREVGYIVGELIKEWKDGTEEKY